MVNKISKCDVKAQSSQSLFITSNSAEKYTAYSNIFFEYRTVINFNLKDFDKIYKYFYFYFSPCCFLYQYWWSERKAIFLCVCVCKESLENFSTILHGSRGIKRWNFDLELCIFLIRITLILNTVKIFNILFAKLIVTSESS